MDKGMDLYSEWAKKYDLPRQVVKSAVGFLFYTKNSDPARIEEVLVAMLPMLKARQQLRGTS